MRAPRRRRIGIFNESTDAKGGSEYLVSVLAEALAPSHEVELVHHNPSLTADELAHFAGTDLSRVRLRYVPYVAPLPTVSRNPWRRYRDQRRWLATLSEGYDLFVTSTHRVPPFCHAETGILLVLFPETDRRTLWPWSDDGTRRRPALWRRARRAYYDWEWEQRFRGYQIRVSISDFAREWTKRWWGIESSVVYPPVDTDFRPVAKSNLILSAGRFATFGVSKRQLEMVSTFGLMKESTLRAWEYYSVGGLSEHPRDRAYFDRVRQVAAASGACTLADVPRGDLKRLYERAKIFWHAAGYEQDGDNPFLAEHFGISTVEAMAAGCVPVVIRKGAQPELVEHGRTGFLWSTLEELQYYTGMLAADDTLRATIAAAARERAQAFDKGAFVTRFMQLLTPVL